jgi:hypothetical protein
LESKRKEEKNGCFVAYLVNELSSSKVLALYNSKVSASQVSGQLVASFAGFIAVSCQLRRFYSSKVPALQVHSSKMPAIAGFKAVRC